MIERQSITLRTATDADADRIAALFTDEGYPAGPSDIVERLARFGSPHSRVVVADYEGEILGFIALHALPRFEHSDRVIRVMALVRDGKLIAAAEEERFRRTLATGSTMLDAQLETALGGGYGAQATAAAPASNPQ